MCVLCEQGGRGFEHRDVDSDLGAGPKPSGGSLGGSWPFNLDGEAVGVVKDPIGGNGPRPDVEGPRAGVGGQAIGDFEVGHGGVRFGAVRAGNEGQTPEADTVPGNNTSTVTLTVGAPALTGYINSPADQDWFRIELEAGQYYEFTMNPVDGLDAILQIRNANGQVLGSQDSELEFATEVLGFYAETAGTYFVSARSYDPPGSNPGSTGQYTISAAEAPMPDILDALDWGGVTVANPEVIHVYFAPAGEQYDGVTSLGWNSYEIGQAMAAFGVYEDIINVTYVQTSNAAEADFKLVTTNSNQYLGYFNPPGTDGAGVGVFARNGSGWVEGGGGGLEQGGYGWITMIHEFGHGMGLAHPHDNGGGSDVLLGVTDAFDSYGLFDLNQGVWTTMSYNDGWATGPNGGSNSLNYGYQATMMALDVAMLQEKYGANMSHATGDNVYVMDTANTFGTYYECIWDAGGNDTISFGGNVPAVIDLRAATIDYSAGGGGFMSWAEDIYGGFTIARGVVIENAVGGSAADSITGNAVANNIQGNGGNDTIRAGGGDDTINGGTGDDTFQFGAGDGEDTISGFVAGGSEDTLVVTGYTLAVLFQEGSDLRVRFDESNSILLTNVALASFTAADINIDFEAGDAEPNVIDGTEEGETLTGTSGDDIINALGGNDVLEGLGGADELNGGEGNDRMVGGAGADTFNGGNGTDQADYRTAAAAVTVNLSTGVATGEGSDTLNSVENVQGSAFADALTGSAGNNNLNGHGGDDALNGGDGNDTLIGGTGGDALNGGIGLDYASYISATGGVSINLLTGVHTGDALGDSFASIERFRLSGFVDVFQGGAGTNYAYGAEGSDSLAGGDGFDRLYGEEGDDLLFGQADNDVLIGGAGADVLDGSGTGKDAASYETAGAAVSVNLTSGVHTGDAAGDTFTDIEFFILSDHADSFTGAAGADEAQGRLGADTLSGAGGNDWMRGGEGGDTLNGDEGDDTLEGGAGADVLNGGDGTDYASYVSAVSINLTSGTHTGDAAGDTFSSIERFSLSSQADSFFGSTGTDWVAGYNGADTLNGAGGDDTLNGGNGADTLIGGDGRDKLIGDKGDDTMTGDAGNDQFIFNGGLFGSDTITDFGNGADKIRLSGIAGVDDFGDLTVSANGSGWAVVTLPDGSTITLTGVVTGDVDAGDFVFG